VKVGTAETVDDGGDLGVAVADSAAPELPAPDVEAPDPEEKTVAVPFPPYGMTPVPEASKVNVFNPPVPRGTLV